jgi:hypothetical protein
MMKMLMPDNFKDVLLPRNRGEQKLPARQWWGGEGMMTKWLRSWLMALMVVVLACDIAVCQQEVEVLVTRGDSLINICKDYLEEPDEWREVAAANPFIKNPDWIFPGQRLAIPARLLKGVPSGGKVSFLKGSVEIMRADAGVWAVLLAEEPMDEGARVRTGDDSALEIIFEDASSFLMKSNTCMRIVKTRKSGALSIIGDLFLESGRVITHIKKATGREPRFQIRTPSAAASVRGTDFRVSHDTSGSTRVEVLGGSVAAKGRQRRVVLYEGEGARIRKGMEPDESRELLAAPALIEPEPLYRRMPLEFRLEPVKGAVSHRLVLARDPEIKDVIREVTSRPKEIAKMTDVADGSYYLQISSVDSLGLEGLPKVAPIEVRVNPVPPFVQSPVSGREYKTVTMEFSWLSVADAVGYSLQIGEDPEFIKVVEERELGDEVSYKTKALEPKTYYFRILSKAADGYRGVYSDAIEFSLLPPPPAPTSEPPKVTRKEITIQWQNFGQGFSYHFQMSRDEDFNEIVVDERVEEPQITLKKPKKGGVYYVRVSSVNSEGFEGHYAQPQSFKVKRFPWELIGGGIVTFGTIVGILVL